MTIIALRKEIAALGEEMAGLRREMQQAIGKPKAAGREMMYWGLRLGKQGVVPHEFGLGQILDISDLAGEDSDRPFFSAKVDSHGEAFEVVIGPSMVATADQVREQHEDMLRAWKNHEGLKRALSEFKERDAAPSDPDIAIMMSDYSSTEQEPASFTEAAKRAVDAAYASWNDHLSRDRWNVKASIAEEEG